jgi:poly-gamma-glutamate synthesis protein (capsule biosynthesis protein)
MMSRFKGKCTISGVLDGDGYLTSLPCSDSVPPEAVTFIACGDTAPVRNLEKISVDGCSDRIIGELQPILDDVDFVFANIEATFSTRGEPLNRVPVFRLDPDAIDLIGKARIKVASLANNHMFDYGPDALVDTVSLLKGLGVQVFGAGLTMQKALEPVIYEMKGISFGFVGFRGCEAKTLSNNGVFTPQMEKEEILAAITALKGRVDWIVVSLHFGLEYRFVPCPDDIRLCRELIDHGANIILGHHPHYPQGVETYNNGLIVYSLGNFIWDQNFVGHTAASYAMQISVSKNCLLSGRVIPFYMKKNYQLCLDKSPEALDELDTLSSILKDNSALSREWYFVTRDHFQLFVSDLKMMIISEQQGVLATMKWWRECVGPRSKDTLKDFLKDACLFKAIRFELGRIWHKQRS